MWTREGPLVPMRGTARYAAPFVLSAFVGVAIQQVLLAIVLGEHVWGAIIVLIAAILVFSLGYVIIDRYAKSVRVLDRTTAGLVATMVILSVGSLVIGEMESSPGIGGNIVRLLALFAVIAFLLPCAAAVLIHWWLLRRRGQTQMA